MSVDLIVVNYKTPRDLDRFLGSLLAHMPKTEATLTIVDVESEPHDRTYEWGAAKLPTRSLGLPDNIGYGRACNRAAAERAGDVIALFNADVELTAGAVDRCHDALLEREDWGVLGPRQIDSSGRIRHAGIFGSLSRPLHRGWNEFDRAQYQDVREAVTVSGSAYFVKRSVWQELTDCPLYQEVAPGALGAFLPTRHYYEETWCSYHCFAHGHQVVYFGEVTICHKWHQASPIGGWADQQMSASRDFFRMACDRHGLAHD